MQYTRSYTVNYTLSEGNFAARYPALARLPFILDSRPAYHRLGNGYLIERGLALWDPTSRGANQGGVIPTDQTMRNYAQWLANFLEWADVRSVDLLTCTYVSHIAGRYQLEMLEGLWSKTGRGLSPTTVNLRVQQACDFLSWLASKGKRHEFVVPYTERTIQVGSATGSLGRLGISVKSRKGRVPARHGMLRMPNADEVLQWLARVEQNLSPTWKLMSETILLTAMRREEVVNLRIDTLPENPNDWHIPNRDAPPHLQQVSITLRYGTKGRSYGRNHGDKIGPVREIQIPLALALRWHEYRRTARNRAFARWMEGVKGAARRAHAQRSVHLFLRESDGARIKGKELYDKWTSVEPPIAGWSPHQGRHWWACSVLLRELKKSEHVAAFTNETSAALLENAAMSIIRFHIQPQLGHANDSTTMIYLRWAMQMFGTPVLLDNDDDELGEATESGVLRK